MRRLALSFLPRRLAEAAAGIGLRLLAVLLAPLPRPLLLAAARAAGWTLARMLPWRVARKNLRIAGSVDPSSWRGHSELELLSRALYHASITALEYFTLLRRDPRVLVEAVEVSGWESVEAAAATGRGLVLVSMHYGNWEVFGACFAARGVPVHALYMEQLSGALDRFLADTRIRAGIRILHQRRGLRECLAALKRGEAVGFVADQDGSRDGIFLEFLGRVVSMPRGPYELARRTGALILPVVGRRLPDGRFRLTIHPGFAVSSGEEVREAALRVTGLFECEILREPEQWLVFYDRFWPRHKPRLVELGLAARAEAEYLRDLRLQPPVP